MYQIINFQLDHLLTKKLSICKLYPSVTCPNGMDQFSQGKPQ